MNQSTNNLSNCTSAFKAQAFTVAEKVDLVIKVLSKSANISQLASEQKVSRNFLYNLAHIGRQELTKVFENETNLQNLDDEKVLFWFPVTKQTIEQMVTALALICKASIRDIIEFLEAIFDYHRSIGTISNILKDVTEKAKAINNEETLEEIKVLAIDEIFNKHKPVLVGTDPKSTYIALLAEEKSCDGTTWGCHLLDLSKKKMKLNFSIADGGKGLRAGQKEAWPEVPCHADVFHVIKDMNELRHRLENKLTVK